MGKSSPVAAFIEDCVNDELRDPQYTVTKKVLYSKFVSYCRKKNLPPDSKNMVTRELQRFAPWIREGRQSSGERKKTWKGIVLKEGGDDNTQQVID